MQLDLFELRSPDFPGERLVACRNEQLAKLRAYKREQLLAATELGLEEIQTSVSAGKLAGKDKIGVRIGKIINKYKAAKHFDLDIEDAAFSYRRKHDGIASDPPPSGRSRASVHLPVHAGLLCRIGFAPRLARTAR